MLVITVNRIYQVIQTALAIVTKFVFQFTHRSVDYFFLSVALHSLQVYFANTDSGGREFLKANKKCVIPLISSGLGCL